MPTAYVRIKGAQGRDVVEYDIGPVYLTLSDVKVGWYRNSFRPQPTGATFNTPNAQIGEGQSSQFVGGSYVTGNVSAFTLAVPDEMQSPAIPPRTLQYDKTFMAFYGAAGGPVAATRTSNTLVVGTGHPFLNGQLVTVRTTGTLPGGLEVLTLYYVVGRTATAISLSHTPGGSVITLSGDGTGNHQVVPFLVAGLYDMADKPSFCNARPVGLL
jgi:hypothetical protein